jgi:hypothetical protein
MASVHFASYNCLGFAEAIQHEDVYIINRHNSPLTLVVELMFRPVIRHQYADSIQTILTPYVKAGAPFP